ncbi:hypothetical protein K7887_18540 [Sutcliffiella horikoshii]|uniref:hypothetical protein n=1 Tax=Sutcliffiella horikoshii TaxID=79883 RepID=UPI001CC081BF|nr:hypothetical protein [Sutcliffiella horikoshii]UAL46840.1 hypothetical protein K7887_18540 [Sutcliffiella horikoshii]
MTVPNEFNLTEVLRSLPASLIFILLVDWFFMKDLVQLYTFQLEASDPNGNYTFITIIAIVFVNLVIISSFARVRYLQEKQLTLAKKVKENSESIPNES